MKLADELRRLQDDVRALASLDPGCKQFGAIGHRYQFKPPYPEAELVAFERTHQVALPDDYRAFITTVGNGGAGPSYGVMPFRGGDSEDYTAYDRIGEPFAYADAFNPTELLDSPDTDTDDADHAYYRAFAFQGSLYICDHGCASRTLLVVSGPCRGEVWADEVANDAGIYPEHGPAGRHGFLGWYRAWLDGLLAKLR